MLYSYTPNEKLVLEEKHAVAPAKTADKEHYYHETRVHGIVYCDSCSAPRCFYSAHSVGSGDGPTKRQLYNVIGQMENGYYCGLLLDEDGFYHRAALRCGDFVEFQYDMPTSRDPGCLCNLFFRH